MLDIFHVCYFQYIFELFILEIYLESFSFIQITNTMTYMMLILLFHGLGLGPSNGSKSPYMILVFIGIK